jgi:hypothetical protein
MYRWIRDVVGPHRAVGRNNSKGVCGRIIPHHIAIWSNTFQCVGSARSSQEVVRHLLILRRRRGSEVCSMVIPPRFRGDYHPTQHTSIIDARLAVGFREIRLKTHHLHIGQKRSDMFTARFRVVNHAVHRKSMDPDPKFVQEQYQRLDQSSQA